MGQILDRLAVALHQEIGGPAHTAKFRRVHQGGIGVGGVAQHAQRLGRHGIGQIVPRQIDPHRASGLGPGLDQITQ